MASGLFRPGATALISGGASGVGFAFASMCRNHGMHVCILDRNTDTLSAATAALKSQGSTSTHPGVKTESHSIDVGDLNAWSSLAPKIKDAFPSGIDILMLNAGTSIKQSTSHPYSDVSYFQSTLQTNMYGVVNGLATFLPTMQESSKSKPETPRAVIITGSKQGITNPPGAGNPAYNMSKSAIKTLAEHLAYDIRTPNNPSFAANTSVHLLIPGWTYTGLSGNPGPTTEEARKKKPNGAWLPEQVAEYAERKINDGKFYIVCPDDDVDEALDQARMEWAVGDVIEGRPALSRWEDNFKDEAAERIKKRAEERRGGK